MNKVSRTITGFIMSIGGFALLLVALFSSSEGVWVALVYGIVLLVLGLFILLNKREDEIEQIKSQGGKK